MSQSKPTLLDVEDEDQRQSRLRSLLERLNDASSSTNVSTDPQDILNISERNTHPVAPPTELLARVQSFLPAIHASNEALAQKSRDEVNVENVEEDEELYIEMNLGLGVFETKRRRSTTSESSTESDSSSSEDDSSSSVDMKPAASRPIKPLPATRITRQMEMQVSNSQPSSGT
ncbi:hypothetical protein SCLCIDRAFT_1214068 [Scleroderma citrinum Foug A]|uniref:Uncharacterized protein n=1 Tax=Scleroderma citrinum Foug A TaxID=1036808 RepID=A0A0C3E5G6_9AGAM|nr:hypothetical protein SCLCIDRAFT_1214068 [Scleroderma citrinum Foug A]